MIFKDKYAVRRVRRVWAATLAGALLCFAQPGQAQWADGDATVVAAKDAARTRDRARLLAARDALIAAQHPLAPWADYWYFQIRQVELSPAEVDEFLARWPDSYVADRARNDWLLELGRRQNWSAFLRVQPGFRMNDDREVACYGLLARQQMGAWAGSAGDQREQARAAWFAQKDGDNGCDAMAKTLLSAGILKTDDVWRKLRLAVESDKPKAVQQAARLLGDPVAQAVARLMSQPQAFLTGGDAAQGGGTSVASRSPGASMGPVKDSKAKRQAANKAGKAKPNLMLLPIETPPEAKGPLNVLAFIRWAGSDPQGAAQAISDPSVRTRWGWRSEEAAWAWAQLGRSAAWRLQPDAASYYERALTDRALAAAAGELRLGAARGDLGWSNETLAWMARVGLRGAVTGTPARWTLVEQALEAMPADMQQDATWQYWRAKMLQARGGEANRQHAREWLAKAAHPLTFYGQLAAEELQGAPAKTPARPPALTESDLAQARALPGVDRALRLLDLGWRTEAVKEWNYTLSYGKPGGLSDRELRAIAEEACRREIWDRCINSSDKTRQEVDLSQRYPTPFREDVLRAAQDVGLDPAYMYGLIRQESRFIVSARSNVGASGLMQVMPATAAWTARKLGIDYHPGLITDRLTNLRIGAGYLKLVLDDLQGSQAMAAAAYNAGPSRPRRWREGTRMDAAVWVENIPFSETRDYVKKVLANATVYAAVLHGTPLSVRNRLGATIGPRADSAPPPEMDLP